MTPAAPLANVYAPPLPVAPKFRATGGLDFLAFLEQGLTELDPPEPELRQADDLGMLQCMAPAMPPIAPPLPPPLPPPFGVPLAPPEPPRSENETPRIMLPEQPQADFPRIAMPTAPPPQPRVEVLTKPVPPKGARAFEIRMKAPAEEKEKRAPLPAPILPRISTDTVAPVFSQPTTPQADAPADPAPVAPVAATATVDAVENAAPAAPPAHHIALRVKADNDRSVDVRLVSRAGEVHVSVHTPDPALARTMRTELGSLTGKLAEAGFGVHGIAAGPGESSSTADRQDSPRENPDSHHQQQYPEQQQQQQQRQHGRGRQRAPFLFDWELN